MDLAVILITLANLFLPTPLPPCVPKFLPAILLLKEKTERVIYIKISSFLANIPSMADFEYGGSHTHIFFGNA